MRPRNFRQSGDVLSLRATRRLLMTTDPIEKKVVLNAPLDRVWRAISDAKEFGAWFGMAFEGPFVQGPRLKGKIVPTTVDAEVAKLQKPHEGKAFEIAVDGIE